MSEHPLWFYKLGKHLIAADEESEAAIRGITNGEAFPITIARQRNLKHLRKYWSLIRMVAQEQEKYPNERVLHIQVKIAAGWYEQHVAEDGTPIYVPKSIAFDAMDQTEFEQYYAEAVEAICRLLPQWDAEHLLEAVDAYSWR